MAGALSDTTEMRLDTSTDGEEDSPDARQRRRERREVKKLMVESKNLLDVEEDDAGDNQSPVIISEVSESRPPPPPAQAAEAGGPDATASGSGGEETPAPTPGTSQNFNAEIVVPKIVLKPPIEISKFNIGTEANHNGAEVQLRASSANPSGADGGVPNLSGGASLTGQSEAVNNTYRAISALKKSNMTNPSIMNGGRAEREEGKAGSFCVPGDGRASICHFRSVIEKKQFISTSFDPKNLLCSSCPDRGAHPVFGGEGVRQCFVLSDQNFPGSLPCASGECLKIVRIENGMLGEIVGCFLDLIKGRELPAGSTVAIFSATHLMMRGLSGYVKDLSIELARLDRIFRGGILSVPGIPVFLGGCEDKTLTREVIEFGNWVKTTGEPFPAETWDTLVEGIIADNKGGAFREEKRKIPLPHSLRFSNPEKSWNSGGWASPSGAQPVSIDTERCLIGSLIAELNTLFNLGLGTDTVHDRLSANTNAHCRYLFIGGSHAKKEGSALADRGHEVVICAASGWRPNKTAVEEMCEKVEEALKMISPTDVVVVHLFDNVSYMARSEEGGDLPIRRYVTGQFHVEGDLVLASKERLFMFFKNALPLLRLLEAYKVIFLTPLPRYLLESCCEAEDHAPNRYNENFEADLRSGLLAIRGHFKDFLFTSNLRGFKIVNPGLCVPTMDASGDPLWGEDPIHPLYSGYEAIVDTILHEASSIRSGKKRQGEELAPAAKRAKAEIPRARWVESPQVPVVMHSGFMPGRGGFGPSRGGGFNPYEQRGGPRGRFRGFRGGRRGGYN
jgi:hypothetical protein